MNGTNCSTAVPFDPLSICNPDGSGSLIQLPCSASILGNIFLIALYGYFLGVGAKWISEGSDMLLEVWGPGVVGGLLLPTLGALPDALVIAMSVLQATDPATLQDDLNVGMGTLVGSNVVLLTIPWCMALGFGKVPLKEGKAQWKNGK
jgi:Ca2+/Na+ antiporter